MLPGPPEKTYAGSSEHVGNYGGEHLSHAAGGYAAQLLLTRCVYSNDSSDEQLAV